MTTAREQWSSIVDAVASMNSREPLPREYLEADYLPGHEGLSSSLVADLRATDGAYEQQAGELFQAQMLPEESFHATPVVSRFTGRSTDTALALSEPEGPNFYENYKATASASARPRALGTTSRLNAGFVDAAYHDALHRQPDFLPIVLVPSALTAPLQLMNVQRFLEEGVYADPTALYVDEATGAVNVQDSKPSAVVVSPGSFLDGDKYGIAFRKFRVVDDPKQVRDWTHVCGCIVDGQEWQFAGWYPDAPASAREPSHLFEKIIGFLPYFEEDKIPPAIQQWRVHPLCLTRRVVKAHQHILLASAFWERLYTFMDSHPFFKAYTVKADEL